MTLLPEGERALLKDLLLLLKTTEVEHPNHLLNHTADDQCVINFLHTSSPAHSLILFAYCNSLLLTVKILV